MKIRFAAVIPLPPEEAFDFVANPANWPRFIASCRSAEALDGWGAPGGRAVMHTTLFGRELVNDLELLEWDRPHRFRYVMHTAGRADTDNVRLFSPASGGGTSFEGINTARPRPGLRGLVDVLSLLGLRQIMRRAMRRLPERAA